MGGVSTREISCIDHGAPSVEFLGNKQRLLPLFLPRIAATIRPGDRVADLFCGTGSVSAGFKSLGATVEANDHLFWCSIFTRSLLENSLPPLFTGLGDISRERGAPHPYLQVLSYLNGLAPTKGFVYRSYSPAAEGYSGHSRMYFTEKNAGRIDAIRRAIESWTPALTQAEASLLVSDLIRASAQVSNIAGTYGCYLKRWKPRALVPLNLKPAAFLPGPTASHRVQCAEAESVAGSIDARIVYADPPYTKRQYAAYYHVLETIAAGDEPELAGSTGLRRWQDKASDWCYRRKAPGALRNLVAALRGARHFFLSYNEDGQIPHAEIIAVLREFGKVSVFEWVNRRYKSSSKPHKGAEVTERLYHLALSARAA